MTVVFLFLDLGTKQWMQTHLVPGQTHQVIAQWLDWTLVHNSGVSFSLLSGHWIIVITLQISVIALLVFIYARSRSSFLLDLGYAMLIGGALGNLVNRAILGYVVDFISFRWWPAIFNVADVEIRVGAVLLLVLYLRNRAETH